jgi:protein TonB
MARELPRSLAVSLAVHAGAVTLLVFTVHFVKPRPLAQTETITAHFLVEDTPAPATPAPLPPVPEPPAPPPPTLEAPRIAPPEPTPVAAPEPLPAPAQPITTTNAHAPTTVATHPRRAGPAAPPKSVTTGGASAGAASAARPRYASNPPPNYPPEARRLKQQGEVLLRVRVAADGSASEVTLKHSSGFPALDEAAIAAVRRWKFEPARVAGVAIAAEVEVPVRFQIKG